MWLFRVIRVGPTGIVVLGLRSEEGKGQPRVVWKNGVPGGEVKRVEALRWGCPWPVGTVFPGSARVFWSE